MTSDHTDIGLAQWRGRFIARSKIALLQFLEQFFGRGKHFYKIKKLLEKAKEIVFQ